MDKAFFQSKEFVLTAIIAGVLLAGGVWAVSASNDFESFVDRAPCTSPSIAGMPLTAQRTDTGIGHERGRAVRTLTYTLPADGLTAGKLDACTGVGDITVGPSNDGQVHITVTMHGLTDETVPADAVEVVFASANGALGIGIAEVKAVEARALFHSESTSVDVVIRLPGLGAWPLRVDSDVGDVVVADLVVGDVDVSTDVGDIGLDHIDGGGNLTVSSDVGDIDVHLSSVASGTIDLQSDVGDIQIALPRRPDVGYSATASSDVGDVDLDLGETERFVRDDEEHGPGDRVEARSAGYDGKPTKVAITARSDVGDIDVKAQ